jgi:uncharacterized protein YqgC (DUF456 family)
MLVLAVIIILLVGADTLTAARGARKAGRRKIPFSGKVVKSQTGANTQTRH